MAHLDEVVVAQMSALGRHGFEVVSKSWEARSDQSKCAFALTGIVCVDTVWSGACGVTIAAGRVGTEQWWE
jgi:hypothetical protein